MTRRDEDLRETLNSDGRDTRTWLLHNNKRSWQYMTCIWRSIHRLILVFLAPCYRKKECR